MKLEELVTLCSLWSRDYVREREVFYVKYQPSTKQFEMHYKDGTWSQFNPWELKSGPLRQIARNHPGIAVYSDLHVGMLVRLQDILEHPGTERNRLVQQARVRITCLEVLLEGDTISQELPFEEVRSNLLLASIRAAGGDWQTFVRPANRDSMIRVTDLIKVEAVYAPYRRAVVHQVRWEEFDVALDIGNRVLRYLHAKVKDSFAWSHAQSVSPQWVMLNAPVGTLGSAEKGVEELVAKAKELDKAIEAHLKTLKTTVDLINTDRQYLLMTVQTLAGRLDEDKPDLAKLQRTAVDEAYKFAQLCVLAFRTLNFLLYLSDDVSQRFAMLELV